MKDPESSKRIQRMQDEILKIQNMRWLPHDIVVQRVLEAKARNLPATKRAEFFESLQRISAKYKKRTGKSYLREYVEEGLLKPEDVGIDKMLADALYGFYARVATQELYAWGKATGRILPAADTLLAKGWRHAADLGVTAPELKDHVIHPEFANGLKEMRDGQRPGRLRRLRHVLGTIKRGQWIKPQIILVYDVLQKYQRGLWSLNPAKEVGVLAEAIRIVAAKTPKYHQLNELNLYQFPHEVPRAERKERIKILLDRTRANAPKLRRALQAATGRSWSPEYLAKSKLLSRIVLAPFDAISQFTWFGDKVIRTASTLLAERMGYPTDEAVRVVSRAHGAYSEISMKYKRPASLVFFVHTFRVMMPMEMFKTAYEPVKAIVERMVKGKRTPRYRTERMVKAIIGTMLIPIMVDVFMRLQGFETDKLGWKWKKTVTDPKTKKDYELVVGINYILNQPIKWFHRMTSTSPIRDDPALEQAFWNLMRWEIHPAYRLADDIRRNKRSFGSDVPVYDASVSELRQAGQIASYAFGQTFRFWGKVIEAADAGRLSTIDKALQKRITTAGLSNVQRRLLNVIGYSYVRRSREEMREVLLKALNRERGSREYWINRRYEHGSTMWKKQIQAMSEWSNECEQWIDKNYGPLSWQQKEDLKSAARLRARKR